MGWNNGSTRQVAAVCQAMRRGWALIGLSPLTTQELCEVLFLWLSGRRHEGTAGQVTWPVKCLVEEALPLQFRQL